MGDNDLEKRIFVADLTPKKPSVNMAINKYYFDSIQNGTYDFVCRVYSHEKGIILGSNESAEDINIDACKERNVEITRRPTGGSFVFVDPEKNLCYSLFFSKQILDKSNIHDIYESIVFPLKNELGAGFVVQGNYYLRVKRKDHNLPVAGHSLYSSDGVFQFDGIVNLERTDVDFLSEIAHLRKMYDDSGRKIIEMNGDFYSLNGRLVVPGKNIRLLDDEELILRQLPGIYEAGVGDSKFVSLLKKSVSSLIEDLHDEHLVLPDKYESLVNHRNIFSGKMKAQGHCFVDFLEPEIKYDN